MPISLRNLLALSLAGVLVAPVAAQTRPGVVIQERRDFDLFAVSFEPETSLQVAAGEPVSDQYAANQGGIVFAAERPVAGQTGTQPVPLEVVECGLNLNAPTPCNLPSAWGGRYGAFVRTGSTGGAVQIRFDAPVGGIRVAVSASNITANTAPMAFVLIGWRAGEPVELDSARWSAAHAFDRPRLVTRAEAPQPSLDSWLDLRAIAPDQVDRFERFTVIARGVDGQDGAISGFLIDDVRTIRFNADAPAEADDQAEAAEARQRFMYDRLTERLDRLETARETGVSIRERLSDRFGRRLQEVDWEACERDWIRQLNGESALESEDVDGDGQADEAPYPSPDNADPVAMTNVHLPVLLPRMHGLRTRSVREAIADDGLLIFPRADVYTAVAYMDEGVMVEIHGSRIIGAQENSREARAMMRQAMDGEGYLLTRTRFGQELTFSRYNVAYAVSITCENPDENPVCADPQTPRRIARALVLAGGAPEEM